MIELLTTTSIKLITNQAVNEVKKLTILVSLLITWSYYSTDSSITSSGHVLVAVLITSSYCWPILHCNNFDYFELIFNQIMYYFYDLLLSQNKQELLKCELGRIIV